MIWNANKAPVASDSFICTASSVRCVPSSIKVCTSGDSYRETSTLLYEYNGGHLIQYLHSCQFNFGCTTLMAYGYDDTPHIYSNIMNHNNNNCLRGGGGASESFDYTETFEFTNSITGEISEMMPLFSSNACQL